MASPTPQPKDRRLEHSRFAFQEGDSPTPVFLNGPALSDIAGLYEAWTALRAAKARQFLPCTPFPRWLIKIGGFWEVKIEWWELDGDTISPRP